jgi:trans-L-3-hydroxyproline dehydratase
MDDPIVIESIIGIHFSVTAEEAVSFGNFPAIIPGIEGSARITGRHAFFIDPLDPLKHGFFMG